MAEGTAAVGVGGAGYNQWGTDSIGNVRVMNLYGAGYAGDPEYNIQDQLVMIPVPGAAALALIGFGILGCPRQRLQ